MILDSDVMSTRTLKMFSIDLPKKKIIPFTDVYAVKKLNQLWMKAHKQHRPTISWLQIHKSTEKLTQLILINQP